MSHSQDEELRRLEREYATTQDPILLQRIHAERLRRGEREPKLKPFSEHGVRRGYRFYCPGCQRAHHYYTGPGQWTFNENLEKPTFTPSLRVFVPAHDNPDMPGQRVAEKTVCHLFVTDGNIVYCGDCDHALNGQTVPLPDWPETHE